MAHHAEFFIGQDLRDRLFYTVNSIGAEFIMADGSQASAAVVLTMFVQYIFT